MIRKDALGEWLANPVTRAYFAGIEDKIKEVEQALGRGVTINDDSSHNTALATARLVGRIDGLRDKVEIDTDTVIEGDDD